ncbi:efflux RND transporter periplasmic adaptor subunit [Trichocoleus sp. FACHB-90]|uniref:efflux RND transporter periplasmic adaptor subunit n=1 Tax=Cyanophyceae TaxID=3028117 RepID=UPI0016883C29|nr:efflux RND transporter periplasmic adaptor subunit [Trichocoleus sp. FACHB-90]MBD1927157.1 efflux RND transporter periplasmic adaptor subunit [Trichocoleus sp. FACHB-90]
MEQQGKKEFKKGVQWLVWSSVGVLAILSAGRWVDYAKLLNRSPDPVEVRLLTVKRGNVENKINESGTVKLGGQQTLKSPAESAVEQVLVELGDRVKSGQKLIVLRNRDQQTSLAAQQLEIQKQELTLERNRQKVLEATEKLNAAQRELQNRPNKQAEMRTQELIIVRNREKIAEEQEKLIAAAGELQQLQALAEKGFIPGKELQDQKQQVRAAESALRDAQLALNTSTLELQRLKQEGQTSQQEFLDKVAAAQSELRQAQSDVNTTTSEIQRLKLDLERLVQQLQNNIVSAPIAGKVLNIMVKNGNGVNLGDNLVTLGDPSQELVELNLSTLNAAKVKVNQVARISVIGPDSQIFKGRVLSLYPQAIASNANSDEQQESQSGQVTVPAIVKMDQPTRKLIPGSQVSVEIILDQRKNVVVLDTEAIQRSKGKPFVWVRDRLGKAQKRNVTLGLEDVTKVEVTSGLRPGDKIVLPSPDSELEPGMPVTAEQESKEGD